MLKWNIDKKTSNRNSRALLVYHKTFISFNCSIFNWLQKSIQKAVNLLQYRWSKAEKKVIKSFKGAKWFLQTCERSSYYHSSRSDCFKHGYFPCFYVNAPLKKGVHALKKNLMPCLLDLKEEVGYLKWHLCNFYLK